MLKVVNIITTKTGFHLNSSHEGPQAHAPSKTISVQFYCMFLLFLDCFPIEQLGFKIVETPLPAPTVVDKFL